MYGEEYVFLASLWGGGYREHTVKVAPDLGKSFSLRFVVFFDVDHF